MKKLKVNFAKFWHGFDSRDNYFFHNLSRRYEVEISSDPDIVFFSVFPGEMPPASVKKVFYTGENVRPDFSVCDWAFGFDYEDEIDNPNYCRLPITLYVGEFDLLLNKPPAAFLMGRPKFCNFLYWQQIEFREQFFKRLSEYKKIDAPGRSMNNCAPIGESVITKLKKVVGASIPDREAAIKVNRKSDGWAERKLPFLKKYKFTLAFENSSYPGYFTEKIVHAMAAGSVPIYWGNPNISRDFNPKSFINYHDFENEEDLIARIIEVDQNDSLLREVLEEPWFNEDVLPEWSDEERIMKQLTAIVEA